MVDKSIERGKLLSICFLAISFLTVFDFLSGEVSQNIARLRKRETNDATFTSFLWSVLLSTISLDQRTVEKSLSYYKQTLSLLER